MMMPVEELRDRGYPIVVDDVRRTDLYFDGGRIPLHTTRVAISPPSWFSKIKLFSDHFPEIEYTRIRALHVGAADGQSWTFHDIRPRLVRGSLSASYGVMRHAGYPWLRQLGRAKVCPDCNGTGMYVGFTATEKCRSCS